MTNEHTITPANTQPGAGPVQAELAAAYQRIAELEHDGTELHAALAEAELRIHQMESESDTPPKALLAKLVATIAASSPVAKHGYHANQQYQYATDTDVLMAVRDAMAANGVFLQTAPGPVEREELPATPGKTPMNAARLTVRFSLWDRDSGESMCIWWPAEARDTADKAVAKAITSALKTFLLKTFLLPAFDDGDTEPGGRPAARPRANGAPPRQPPPPGVDPNTGEVKTINEKQIKMIRLKLAQAKVGESVACEQARVLGLEDLTNHQLDELLAWLAARRKPQ